MKTKQRLDFEQLEQEMDVLTLNETLTTKGGGDPANGDTFVIDGTTLTYDSSLKQWLFPGHTVMGEREMGADVWTYYSGGGVGYFYGGQNYYHQSGGGIPPTSTLVNVANVTALGADFHNTALAAAKLATQEAGSVFKIVTSTGTIIGAIAGGGPAAVNIYQALRSGHVPSRSDIASFALAAGGLVLEFSGEGEFIDGISVVVNGTSLFNDITNAWAQADPR